MRTFFILTAFLALTTGDTDAHDLSRNLRAIAFAQNAKGDCPQSFSEWAEWRASLFRDAASPSDLVKGERGKLLDQCRGRPDQKAFFQDPRFDACMRPLSEIQGLLVAFEKGGKEQFDGLLSDTVLPKNTSNDDSLPADASKSLFAIKNALKAAAINSEEVISTPNFTGLVNEFLSKLPGSPVAFAYKSNTNHLDGLIIIFDIPNGERLIHLDPKEILKLTIIRKNAFGKALEQPLASFQSTDEFQGDTLKPHQVSRCIACHNTGIMPVSADPKYPVRAFGKKRSEASVIDWFNNDLAARDPIARIANYPSHAMPYPQYGEVDPAQRTDAFMARCIAASKRAIAPARIPVVKKAMNCASCHDGAAVGKFSPYFRPPDFASLERNFIHDRLMPPGSTLSEDEGEALLTCLNAEYYGGFKDVALGGDSEPGTFIRELTKSTCPTDIPAASVSEKKNTKKLQDGRGANPGTPSGPLKPKNAN